MIINTNKMGGMMIQTMRVVTFFLQGHLNKSTLVLFIRTPPEVNDGLNSFIIISYNISKKSFLVNDILDKKYFIKPKIYVSLT